MPSTAKKYNATVIVTSDTCFEDPSIDESGSYVVEQLNFTELFAQVKKLVMRDDKLEIVNCLKATIDEDDPALIITVGGTGLCPRDVTPEATSSLYDRHCNGIVIGLFKIGLRYAPNASLSRLTSGVIGGTLVVNLPGKLRACKEYVPWLVQILEHALEQVRFDYESYKRTHKRQEELDQIQPDDSVSSVALNTGAVSNGLRSFPVARCNGQIELPNVSRLKLQDDPSPRNSRFSASSQITGRRPESNPSLSSKLTIEEIMESRSEFPLADSLSQASGVSSRKRPPSSVRSLKTHIVSRSNQNKTMNPPKPANQPKPFIKPIQSSFPLIGFQECLNILSTMSEQLLGAPVDVTLHSHGVALSCLGSVLARDLKSKRQVPPYNVSTMDGYVLHIPSALKNAIKDTKSLPPSVRLVSSLKDFEHYQTNRSTSNDFFCYQVNTGGRLPKFNYAVIPFEKTGTVSNNMVPILEVNQGAHVRRAGSDLSHDDTLLAGTKIGPVELSTIMAMGHKSISIYQKPKIGVLSTGDELEDFFANKTLDDEGVVDTNGPLLMSMLRLKGYTVNDLGVAYDEPSDICAKLEEGLKKNDVILVTGGASMGTKDHVKSVISHLGGTIHFGRVNMKPGKPVAFASLGAKEKRKFIFSLPGNPVSAYVTATMLVIPFIRNGMKNHNQQGSQISFESVGDLIHAEIGELYDGNKYPLEGRLEFIRAKIVSQKVSESRPLYVVKVSVKQQSSRMLNLVDCDCLIMIDPELKGECLTVGSKYPAYKLHRNH